MSSLCTIAHNNQLTRNDYERILAIVEEIKPQIDKAIDNLDNVKVDDVDSEILSENFMSLNDAGIAEFVEAFKKLAELIGHLCAKNGVSSSLAGSSRALAALYHECRAISLEEYQDLKDLYMIRNSVVHGMRKISDLAMEEELLKVRKMMAVIERKIYFGKSRNPRV